MQIFLKTCFALLVIFLFAKCNKDQTTELLSKPCIIPDTEKNLIESSNKIGFECFKEIALVHENNENIIFSPIGISQSLSFLIHASENNTKSELKRILHIPDLQDSIIDKGFNHLNNLYSELDYSSKLINSSKIALPAEVSPDSKFDFYYKGRNYVEVINDEDAGLIEEYTDKSLTVKANGFQLINSINFSAKSKYQIRVEESPFYNNPNDSRFVEMIVSKSGFNFYQDQTVKAIEIPLGRGNFNMLFIVPQNTESIGDLCRKLDRNLLERINRKFRIQQLEVIMPVIEMKGIKSFKDIFMNSKLPSGFREKLADFSNLSKSENLYISDIEQIIDLNISRKETDSDISPGSAEKENQGTILIDHPFVFVIYEKYSNGILFIGKIVSL